jgi:hypothetical protein
LLREDNIWRFCQRPSLGAAGQKVSSASELIRKDVTAVATAVAAVAAAAADTSTGWLCPQGVSLSLAAAGRPDASRGKFSPVRRIGEMAGNSWQMSAPLIQDKI